MTRSRELDPQKKGVNVILQLSPARSAAPITLKLRNIPLLHALRFAAGVSGLELTSQEQALVIREKAGN